MTAMASLIPLIGHWRWDGGARMLVRLDDCTVRYLGRNQTRPVTGNRCWHDFAVRSSEGEVVVPVEQRLLGRDDNFRALWYRVDFRELEPGFASWSASEWLLIDALSCWPIGDLAGGYPTGIGVEGAVLNGRFRPDIFRLHLPGYSKVTPVGTSPIPPTVEQRWTYHPLDRSKPEPDLAGAASGTPDAIRRAVAQAAARGPTLASGDRRIVILPTKFGVRLLYADAGLIADSLLGGAPYRDQDYFWSFWDDDGGAFGRIDPATGLKPGAGVVDAVRAFFEPRKASSRSRPEEIDPALAERLYSSVHEALLLLEEPRELEVALEFPPTIVAAPAPWRRAGHLRGHCLTATALRDDRLVAAFAETPPEGLSLRAPMGVAFDHDAAAMLDPDGSILGLDAVLEGQELLAPTAIRLRCRAMGLDWPVIVRRDDRRPEHSFAPRSELQSRWVVDHGECLAAWRLATNGDIPPAVAWDRLRQFLEDALLSWGDTVVCGPAPLSLATIGGWYDGAWRGSELRRLMSRPNGLGKPGHKSEWKPYEAARQWRRTDTLPVGLPEVCSSGYTVSREPPPPFAKEPDEATVTRTGAARWAAAGFVFQSERETERRVDLASYRDGQIELVCAANRSHAVFGRVAVTGSADVLAGMQPWPSPDTLQEPNLEIWRKLRDATESGLRSGEATRVQGVYLFDQFHPGALRLIVHDAPLDDFDNRLSGLDTSL
jgi:hypothetical protein